MFLLQIFIYFTIKNTCKEYYYLQYIIIQKPRIDLLSSTNTKLQIQIQIQKCKEDYYLQYPPSKTSDHAIDLLSWTNFISHFLCINLKPEPNEVRWRSMVATSLELVWFFKGKKMYIYVQIFMKYEDWRSSFYDSMIQFHNSNSNLCCCYVFKFNWMRALEIFKLRHHR